MKNAFILMILMVLSLSERGDLKAQKISTYKTMDGKTLQSGDTVQFLEGSLGGQFVHVFFMVGSLQKRKATFSREYYSELIISHFINKKKRDEIYMVMGIPNKSKWFVWAEVEAALKTKEIMVKEQ